MYPPLTTHTAPTPTGPVVVVVLDGIGIGRSDESNAVHLARTPTMDMLNQISIKTSLLAHGTHVGMPTDKDMGNSEVGHNALGSGRIYSQGATLVEQAISSGTLFDSGNETSRTWQNLIQHINANGSTLHLIGLLSDGNVHSNIKHIEKIITEANKNGVDKIRIHALMDGRDVSGQSAQIYVARLEEHLNSFDSDYQIASGGGRMLVTMDRYEADWGMVEIGWKTHVLGEGPRWPDALTAINNARAKQPNLNDQFLPPFVIEKHGEPVGTIQNGDAVLLFNFRGDRAIELTRAFEEDNFPYFDRQRRPDVLFVGMMQYDGDLGLPSNYLVSPPSISGTMGERLTKAGVKQLAVSETQKYGHVTYFWNGNRTDAFSDQLETYIEIPSDRVVFDERPWMKAAEITDATINALNSDPEIRFARINYPNGDMVGHTGNLEATVLAVEAADLSLARLLQAIEKLNGAVIVTADHGNADQMFQYDKNTGEIIVNNDGSPVPMTAHTLNPVPIWIYTPSTPDMFKISEIHPRRLSNVAATALLLMGFEPPHDMDPPLIEYSGKQDMPTAK